ncbi:hypothetical protein ABQE57_22245 [Mycolicibacterium elephantis]
MTDSPKPKEQPVDWKPVRLRLIHEELTAIDAKVSGGSIGKKARKRLDQIVSQAGRQAKKGPGYRRLYERALRVQRKVIMAPTRSKPRGRASVSNPDLFLGGREVLGGLPSSRRGH